MRFPALSEFLSYLESIGELKRISIPVDSYLEVTEISMRALRENRPALLFENIKGAKYPLAINIYASERRIELALGRHPQEIGEEIVTFIERLSLQDFSAIWENRNLFKSLMFKRPGIFARNISQEVVEEPDLDKLPVITCWPKDGGRFITQGLVFTYNPINNVRNVGLYRLHVYDKNTTGMHWQIQKGGGFHFYHAEILNKPLEVAVALGTEPAVLFAGISALPEGIDELILSSIISGRKIPTVKGKSISIEVPKGAEFILEGIVCPGERRNEGPFGDHFGYYSNRSPFPVFHIKKITHRKNPVYPATVVGIPPMEDKFMGDAVQWILNPLIKLLHKEVYDIWAYYEAGFHNLLVISVENRYRKEAIKTALGLLGTGQLSLTKVIILVSKTVDPRNWNAVLREIHDNFDPTFDFLLIPGMPLDTLDFTSFKKEIGSKMILDATRENHRFSKNSKFSTSPDISKVMNTIEKFKKTDKRIEEVNLIEKTLLIVKVNRNGREILEKMVKLKDLQSIKVIAVVSNDIDINNQENYIWGIFTRFDCERDLIFAERKFQGASVVYKGTIGIDATLKPGYPDTVKMTEKIKKLVDNKWDKYWK